MMGLIGAQTTRAAVSAPVMLSVIINNYNYEQFVSKAIESLLEHKPGGLEIIVVNDCSTDPPRDVILGYQRRTRAGIRRILTWTWWTVFLHVPQEVKCTLMELKPDPVTRPD
jgi:cellulose synthase/poly-beta-1,6-N-acetylglucosamine synthase-like glycosyltransferase